MSFPAGAPVGPPVPYTEAPIYLQDAHRGDHHYYDKSDTTVEERRPISGRECWIDIGLIPSVPPLAPTPTVTPASATLTAVPGNPYQFGNVAFVDMIPANYGSGAYEPTLVDSAGKTVPYNPSVWVADGIRSVVEFKYQTPAQLGYAPPFTLSYWQYTGGFAGGGGGGGSPANVALYVDDTGSDSTGDGSLANPFATLQRAFAVLNSLGWNNTASVIIVQTLTVQTGTLINLNAGSGGSQTSPASVAGMPRTSPVRTDTVSGVAVDPVTGLLSITTGGGWTDADVGRIVRFTTGPLAAYTIPTQGFSGFHAPPAPPPFELEVFAGKVTGPNTVELAYSDTTQPEIGDAVAVFDNVSRLVVNAAEAFAPGVFTSGTPLVFRDLDFVFNIPVPSPPAPVQTGVGGLLFWGFDVDLVGARFITPGYGGNTVIAHGGGLFRAGVYAENPITPPSTPSVLGIAAVAATPGVGICMITQTDNSVSMFSNSVFAAGAPAAPNSGSTIQGPATLLSCVLSGSAQLTSDGYMTTVSSSSFDGLTTGGVTLSAAAGSVLVTGCRFSDSVTSAVAVSLNGAADVQGPVAFTNCAAAIAAQQGGLAHLDLAGGAITVTGGGISGSALTAQQDGTIIMDNGFVTTSGTFAGPIIDLEGGTFLVANSPGGTWTVGGSAPSFPVISVVNGGEFFGETTNGTTLAVTATSGNIINVDTLGLFVFPSVSVIGATPATCVNVAGGATLLVPLTLVTTGGAIGLNLATGGTARLGAVNISGTSSNNVFAVPGGPSTTLAVAGGLTSQGSAGLGLLLLGCDLYVGGDTDVTANAAGSIVTVTGSSVFGGSIAAAGNASNNVLFAQTTTMLSSLDVSGATGTGLSLIAGTAATLYSTLTASGGTGLGVYLTDSTAFILNAVTVSNNGNGGIVVTEGSRLQIDSSLTATGNTGDGLRVLNGSTVTVVGGGVDVSNSSGNGVYVSEGSVCTVGNTTGLTAGGCATGALVDTQSSLLVAGPITAEDCLTNPINISGASQVRSGSIYGNQAVPAGGVVVVGGSSLDVSGDLTCGFCRYGGLELNASTARVTGTVDVTGCGLGLFLGYPSLLLSLSEGVFGSVTASTAAAFVTPTSGVVEAIGSTLTVANGITSPAGNLAGLRAVSSQVLMLAGTLDVSAVSVAPANINGVDLLASTFDVTNFSSSNLSPSGICLHAQEGSRARIGGTASCSNAGNGLVLFEGSSLLVDTVTIGSAVLNPVSLSIGSELTVTTGGTITGSTGPAISAANNSSLNLVGLAISQSGLEGILLQAASTASLSGVTINVSGADGIDVFSGSTLWAGGGAVNSSTGVGVYASGLSTVYLSSTNVNGVIGPDNYGVLIDECSSCFLTGLDISGSEIGVYINGSSEATINAVTGNNASAGLFVGPLSRLIARQNSPGDITLTGALFGDFAVGTNPPSAPPLLTWASVVSGQVITDLSEPDSEFATFSSFH
jgi:hypothetical protein